MLGYTGGSPVTGTLRPRCSAKELGRRLGVSSSTAWRILREQGYRMRANRKRLAFRQSADRNRQFRHIGMLRRRFLAAGQPIISVDTKKRELVGLFKNPGRHWGKRPREVSAYDFPSDAKGVAIPTAVYDDIDDDGAVLVGTKKNTPELTAAAIRYWWTELGHASHRDARQLLLLVDSGGATSTRSRRWKCAVHQLAVALGVHITVAHYPTGASKWNPVEHRLLSAISKRWAGIPLESYHVIVNLLRSTTTGGGKRVHAKLDRRRHRPIPPSYMPIIVHHRVLPKLNYTALAVEHPANIVNLF